MNEQPIQTSDVQEFAERKKEVLKLLETVRSRFILSRPFYANLGFALKLKVVADDRVQTAATDGKTIFFSVFFWEKLEPEERVFVFAHELLHCALGHFFRRGLRDHDLWNIAVDQEVNHILSEEGFRMPKGGILERSYLGLSAEQVYEKLKMDINVRRMLSSVVPEGNQPSSGLFDPEFTPQANTSLADHAVMVSTARRAARRKGGQGMDENNRRLPRANPSKPSGVAWRMVLASFFDAAKATRTSWHRPSRRHIGRGLYMPSRVKGDYKLTIAIDVSGSTQKDLPQFMSELKSILQVSPCSDLTIITFDHRVRSVEHPADLSDVEVLSNRLIGGGGTDIDPVFEYIRTSDDEHQNIIILTDGYFKKPRNSLPSSQILYVVSKDGDRNGFMENAIQLTA